MTYDGETALMTAAHHGHAECARLLLDAGADPTLRLTGGHRRGKSALELAEEPPSRVEKGKGHDEIAALLVERLPPSAEKQAAMLRAHPEPGKVGRPDSRFKQPEPVSAPTYSYF